MRRATPERRRLYFVGLSCRHIESFDFCHLSAGRNAHYLSLYRPKRHGRVFYASGREHHTMMFRPRLMPGIEITSHARLAPHSQMQRIFTATRDDITIFAKEAYYDMGQSTAMPRYLCQGPLSMHLLMTVIYIRRTAAPRACLLLQPL